MHRDGARLSANQRHGFILGSGKRMYFVLAGTRAGGFVVFSPLGHFMVFLGALASGCISSLPEPVRLLLLGHVN